jgi:hypothetical protein
MKYDWMDDILTKLTAECGEEYHLLHTDRQDFKTTDARMKFYEQQAKKSIIKKLDNTSAYWVGHCPGCCLRCNSIMHICPKEQS